MRSHSPQSSTPAEALAQLLAGNERYVAGQVEHPRQDASRRAALSGGQQPFAVILSCSDSRVVPELIFDQGLGDLFVIRVAGNIVDESVLASIEYAAAHLHTPLIMVLGHAQCGAVSAAAAGAPLEGHLPRLVRVIQPALDRAGTQPGDFINNAIRENARLVADQLRAAPPILAKLVKAEQIKITAAHYDLDSGKVSLLA